MADFKKAWIKTSKTEGGYVNNSSDKGKETYRGIARGFWPLWEGWPIIDQAKIRFGYTSTIDASVEIRRILDKELSIDVALALLIDDFYKRNFWDVLKLDSEESQAIAEKIFDVAVNMGVKKAEEFLIEARKGII